MASKYQDCDITSDINALFDADNYLEFNKQNYLTEHQTDAETGFLRKVLALDKTLGLLDVACGHGRHANRLAKEVHSVVGVDNNEAFIALANETARSMSNHNVLFIEQDIRELNVRPAFDRALLINTIFGLFSDQENFTVLTNINKALSKGGLLCLDIINRDNALVGFEEHGIIESDEGFLLDRLSFNGKTGRMNNRRVYVRDGIRTDAHFSIRLFNYTEINLLLNQAGFAINESFSGWSASPLLYSSKKIIIVAQKVGEVA